MTSNIASKATVWTVLPSLVAGVRSNSMALVLRSGRRRQRRGTSNRVDDSVC
jgi:hypothetical protein